MEIKDALGAVSLVFTALTFFVSRRVDDFERGEIEPLSLLSALRGLLDLLLACVAALVLLIIWPLLKDSSAFGSFSEPEDVLPNLLAVIAVGFAAIALIEAALGLLRLGGGVLLRVRRP